MGDPGYSAAAGYGSDDEGTGDWWSAESGLLKAPKRAAGPGINYNHSAKQVGALVAVTSSTFRCRNTDLLLHCKVPARGLWVKSKVQYAGQVRLATGGFVCNQQDVQKC